MSDKITSIKDIKKQALGELVTLPGWSGDPVVFRLKRPSLLSLAEKGSIPNTLLGTAAKVFNEGTLDKETNLKDISKLLDVMAEAAMIEPTMKELEQEGIELTDVQKIVIFNYTQAGIKAVENFRAEQPDTKDNKSS